MEYDFNYDLYLDRQKESRKVRGSRIPLTGERIFLDEQIYEIVNVATTFNSFEDRGRKVSIEDKINVYAKKL